jgi:hypothetical protein
VKIVSDAGPILSFTRAGRLEILRQVVGELIIPEAVVEELAVRGKGRPGADKIELGTWIKRENVQDRSIMEQFSGRLGLGEREALALAKQTGAALLVDEREKRGNALGNAALRKLKKFSKRRRIGGSSQERNPFLANSSHREPTSAMPSIRIFSER